MKTFAYTAGREYDAARDTLVFVHGAAMDHSAWNLQSRYFAHHGYNVLAFDLPGHGRTAGKFDSIAAAAQWLHRQLADSRARGVHFIGHSMGALIALECAANYAHAHAPLRSLALLGFAYPMRVNAALLTAARDTPAEAMAMMTQWSHASQLGGEPPPGFWAPGMQFQLMRNSKPGVLLADLQACNEYTRGEQSLAQTACPILFLCGKGDRMAPHKRAAQHAQHCADAKVTLLDHCGHNLMAESPHAVLRALQQHLSRAEKVHAPS